MTETDKVCAKCKHQIVERHEDYLEQPMWYMGDCEYKLVRVAEADCPSFEKGSPIREDCRIFGVANDRN